MLTILIPVDFSDCSYLVLAEALKQAQELDAQLTLLYVVQGAEDKALLHLKEGPPRSIQEHLLEDAEAQMRLYTPHFKGYAVERRVEEGEVLSSILRVAQEIQADEIIMGSHGRQGLARWIYGGLAQQVKKRAQIPVRIIKSVHKNSCEARSCATCNSGVSEAVYQLRAEEDG